VSVPGSTTHRPEMDNSPSQSGQLAGVGVADLRLSPRVAQQVFRAVLDALSRPGRTVQLPRELPGSGRRVARIGTVSCPSALLPLLALADLDTPFHVLGAEPGAVATATSAPVTAVEQARLIAALRPMTRAELAAAHVGTAAAPETAALVTLAVPALDGGPALRLTGPGTGDGATFAPTGLPDGWAGDRAEFPTGYDLLLVDPDGRCAGIPRSTHIEES